MWPDWLNQCFNELPLGESIASDYLMWKSEQHKLTPKYGILCSLLTLVKHYFVTMKDYDNKCKRTCQRCNGFSICTGGTGELLYITFLCAVSSTIGIYSEDLDAENVYFQ